MFSKDSDLNSSPSQNNGMENTVADFLRMAKAAEASADLSLALHLYIAAFEKASVDAKNPDAAAIEGLRNAWDLACRLKERSLAEYIFERLEPYLTHDEVAHNAEQLQRMALDKLEEFGFSHDDVQEMADMISEDFVGFGAGGLMQMSPEILMTHSMVPSKGALAHNLALPAGQTSSADSKKIAVADDASKQSEEQTRYRYADLVGYDTAIDKMHIRGIGLSDDSSFNDFLSMLARRHGIDSPPSTETMVFRAYAREDANQFMAATVGELNVPTVRMYMEESPQGLPVLCLMASADFKSHLHLSRHGFDGPGALVLEDIDLWGSPLAGQLDEFDVNSFAQLSRGAREAVNLIRSAVENHKVTVMATCSTEHPLEDFFYDLLDPISIIDIDVPNDEERKAVWKQAATMYPSLRFIDRDDLVRFSAHMSRYDIYMAARESVDQAYTESVERRTYVPVTRGNVFDKVAAYQPLDSNEYHRLEDAAVESLRADIENIDDLLKGSAE